MSGRKHPGSKLHDASYRKLFSHKPMIEDLLRRFAEGPWLEKLDFDSLEPVPTEHVAEGLQQRQDDLIWRLRSAKTSTQGTPKSALKVGSMSMSWLSSNPRSIASWR